MNSQTLDYDETQWDNLKRILQHWNDSEHIIPEHAEFELGYGIVLEISNHPDDPIATVDVLLTEEPHYLKRSIGTTLMDNGSEMDTLNADIEAAFRKNGFEDVDMTFEYDESNSNGMNLIRFTSTVENPNFKGEYW